MKMNKGQLLVIGSDVSAQAISKAVSDFSGIKMIRADSYTTAIELMVTTSFALVFMEDDIPEINPLKIAERLSNLGNSGATPLVFITNSTTPLELLKSFPSLSMDFLSKPLDPVILKAKIKIFFELYQNKTAVAQSIGELDHAYGKIMELQRSSLKEQELRKETTNFSSAFAGQIQSPLKDIHAGIYQLTKARDLPFHLGQGVSHIRNAVNRIAGITKRLSALANKAPRRLTCLTDDTGEERPCIILYVTGFKDEFDIFQHYIKGALNYNLLQAQTIDQAKEIISARDLDIIFIDHLLSDGTEFDLLSDLRLRSNIPIIFTMDKSHGDPGAKAVVKKADNFFLKEKISTRNILSIIRETLEKSRLAKEIKEAQERIVLISRRDHLTNLYNRQYFDKGLNAEINKARRYKFPLSILMVDFDKFKTVNQTLGYETGDQILKTSAALIRSMVRNIDVVCRYGGDQFGILLPNTSRQGAKILARRILKEINSHGFDMGDKSFNLTVSIGIASHTDNEYPSQNQDQYPVNQALKALEKAIQQGGNTIQHLPETKSDHTHD
ncbi:MAG: diguanylate cyclase [Desulfobacteraceae bacterium]|nr:diguanylate cyclase [Desulfobacteraceae bacterium]